MLKFVHRMYVRKGSFRRLEDVDFIQRAHHTMNSECLDINFWLHKGRVNCLNCRVTIINSSRIMSWSNLKETLKKSRKFYLTCAISVQHDTN